MAYLEYGGARPYTTSPLVYYHNLTPGYGAYPHPYSRHRAFDQDPVMAMPFSSLIVDYG